ncbi:mucin-5AC-like isoform X20 [Rhinatrema bivittatum]|uniref:mucin-5AC-like isoform X20 n=1 Tax=Rhinatrema bivittatum TaxID=194408 RepID=UPI00112710FC|nr:mucin-5AC-like isoform X20 [Rhinatrema bivittatum]
MGEGKRIPLLSWILVFAILYFQKNAQAQQCYQMQSNMGDLHGFRSLLRDEPPMLPAENDQVCTSWGNFHFKTFDGDIFYFPGTCNYLFASHCSGEYEDFNVQIKRVMVNGTATIGCIVITISGVVIEVKSSSTVCNGNEVQLPFSHMGIQVVKTGMYVMVSDKKGLVFKWQENSIELKLDHKYANKTCGLCGDFNGQKTYNEFILNGVVLTPIQFGGLQKLDGPEECEDPTSSPVNCTDTENICETVLTGSVFSICNGLVGVAPYIEACIRDLCLCHESDMKTSCLCDTFAEYSHQCALAGGYPENWRTPDFCPLICPFNMLYQECGIPCVDTCSDFYRSQFCDAHCVRGCFCPTGTVYDDISNSGCVPQNQCPCTYSGQVYAPETTYATSCQNCTCFGGQWNCKELACFGFCSVEGGSHFTTFDEVHYNFNGDCVYVLAKVCTDDSFTVLGKLVRCGMKGARTCLDSVILRLNGGKTTIEIKALGNVLVNSADTQLPVLLVNVTIFRPSSFFIIVHTNFGLQLQIQIIPMLQLYIRLKHSYRRKMCGLCGNFNNIQVDDFKTMSGVVEGTAVAFANSWKTQASCPNIKNIFEDPCAFNIETENYAHYWCALLVNSTGPFAKCHNVVTPDIYYKNCVFDTCICMKSETCMCAAISSYVRACAAKGILLTQWRADVCDKYTTCPESFQYKYVVTSCEPTCRSLSEHDITCDIQFTPVDGCTCKGGRYLDANDTCVPSVLCSCYHKGDVVPVGYSFVDDGMLCTCHSGRLSCIGHDPSTECTPPKIYFNCTNAPVGTKGSECQKSCQNLEMHCYSTQCVSGCMCSDGLVFNDKEGCIPEEKCPCIHNGVAYKSGDKIKIHCNTCECKQRKWKCTKHVCLGTCMVYGEGNYITFDDKRYSFSGDCDYVLAQDHCGTDSTESTFRVITENIPCGTTGTTCARTVKIYVGSYTLMLSDEKFKVVAEGSVKVIYTVRTMGIYLVIEFDFGLILLWDKKTTIFIKLTVPYKGKVCGLCGNYDGNANNDFTTRHHSVVGNVIEFGNSWKTTSTCPDAIDHKDPCTSNPYRKAWAQKQCSIITGHVFAPCHYEVDPAPYYDACVKDACACDTGGDCECFCTAVAAYAQACNEVGVCIAWRTPEICPLFCDYYNPTGECEWHYKPCGHPCLKTCQNPSGMCFYKLSGLEGCYPNCPDDKPYFDEEQMKCVDQCGCYGNDLYYYKIGQNVPSCENCTSCNCSMGGIECKYDEYACYCMYNGVKYKYNEIISSTIDNSGLCKDVICGINGTIHTVTHRCLTTARTTAKTATKTSTSTIVMTTTLTTTETTTETTSLTTTPTTTPPRTTPRRSTTSTHISTRTPRTTSTVRTSTPHTISLRTTRTSPQTSTTLVTTETTTETTTPTTTTPKTTTSTVYETSKRTTPRRSTTSTHITTHITTRTPRTSSTVRTSTPHTISLRTTRTTPQTSTTLGTTETTTETTTPTTTTPKITETTKRTTPRRTTTSTHITTRTPRTTSTVRTSTPHTISLRTTRTSPQASTTPVTTETTTETTTPTTTTPKTTTSTVTETSKRTTPRRSTTSTHITTHISTRTPRTTSTVRTSTPHTISVRTTPTTPQTSTTLGTTETTTETTTPTSTTPKTTTSTITETTKRTTPRRSTISTHITTHISTRTPRTTSTVRTSTPHTISVRTTPTTLQTSTTLGTTETTTETTTPTTTTPKTTTSTVTETTKRTTPRRTTTSTHITTRTPRTSSTVRTSTPHTISVRTTQTTPQTSTTLGTTETTTETTTPTTTTPKITETTKRTTPRRTTTSTHITTRTPRTTSTVRTSTPHTISLRTTRTSPKASTTLVTTETTTETTTPTTTTTSTVTETSKRTTPRRSTTSTHITTHISTRTPRTTSTVRTSTPHTISVRTTSTTPQTSTTLGTTETTTETTTPTTTTPKTTTSTITETTKRTTPRRSTTSTRITTHISTRTPRTTSTVRTSTPHTISVRTTPTTPQTSTTLGTTETTTETTTPTTTTPKTTTSTVTETTKRTTPRRTTTSTHITTRTPRTSSTVRTSTPHTISVRTTRTTPQTSTTLGTTETTTETTTPTTTTPKITETTKRTTPRRTTTSTHITTRTPRTTSTVRTSTPHTISLRTTRTSPQASTTLVTTETTTETTTPTTTTPKTTTSTVTETSKRTTPRRSTTSTHITTHISTRTPRTTSTVRTSMPHTISVRTTPTTPQTSTTLGTTETTTETTTPTTTTPKTTTSTITETTKRTTPRRSTTSTHITTHISTRTPRTTSTVRTSTPPTISVRTTPTTPQTSTTLVTTETTTETTPTTTTPKTSTSTVTETTKRTTPRRTTTSTHITTHISTRSPRTTSTVRTSTPHTISLRTTRTTPQTSSTLGTTETTTETTTPTTTTPKITETTKRTTPRRSTTSTHITTHISTRSPRTTSTVRTSTPHTISLRTTGTTPQTSTILVTTETTTETTTPTTTTPKTTTSTITETTKRTTPRRTTTSTHITTHISTRSSRTTSTVRTSTPHTISLRSTGTTPQTSTTLVTTETTTETTTPTTTTPKTTTSTITETTKRTTPRRTTTSTHITTHISTRSSRTTSTVRTSTPHTISLRTTRTTPQTSTTLVTTETTTETTTPTTTTQKTTTSTITGTTRRSTTSTHITTHISTRTPRTTSTVRTSTPHTVSLRSTRTTPQTSTTLGTTETTTETTTPTTTSSITTSIITETTKRTTRRSTTSTHITTHISTRTPRTTSTVQTSTPRTISLRTTPTTPHTKTTTQATTEVTETTTPTTTSPITTSIITETTKRTTPRRSTTSTHITHVSSSRTTRPFLEETSKAPNETVLVYPCFNATCIEKTIMIEFMKCPPILSVTCFEGVPPKKIYDEDGCCYHYECDYCEGPEGEKKKPGDYWISNCKNCYCDNNFEMNCEPIICMEPTAELCTKEGFEPIRVLNPDNPCCNKTECRCNPNLCKISIIKPCQPGYELTSSFAEGDCCITFICKPKNVCVVNGIEYKPGMPTPSIQGKCKECTCSTKKDQMTGLNVVTCKDIFCHRDCQLGYMYVTKPGECCGECVQQSCIVQTDEGTVHVLQPGETWYPATTNCTYYRCDKVGTQFITVEIKKTCPVIEPKDCESGIIQKTPDGCCKTCKAPRSCGVRSESRLIKIDACENTANFTYCEGVCRSSSMFAKEEEKMAHKCTCCQELKTKYKEVELFCPNGFSIKFQFIFVETCGCVSNVCVPLVNVPEVEEE